MTTRPALGRLVQISNRIQQLTREIENLVPEVKAALAQANQHGHVLSSASMSLERAAAAVRALVERQRPRPSEFDIRAILGGTSPLMSLFGSRVVLARTGNKTTKTTPSTGARALAILLENPTQAFEAKEIAKRLACSVPIARTTLNRLVRSGHATRPAAGRFRAKAR
jgi:hypothetical protein